MLSTFSSRWWGGESWDLPCSRPVEPLYRLAWRDSRFCASVSCHCDGPRYPCTAKSLVLQGQLFKASFLRNTPLFVQYLAENVCVCLGASFLEATSKRCLQRIELIWRNKLTTSLQNSYFANMVCLQDPQRSCKICAAALTAGSSTVLPLYLAPFCL